MKQMKDQKFKNGVYGRTWFYLKRVFWKLYWAFFNLKKEQIIYSEVTCETQTLNSEIQHFFFALDAAHCQPYKFFMWFFLSWSVWLQIFRFWKVKWMEIVETVVGFNWWWGWLYCTHLNSGIWVTDLRRTHYFDCMSVGWMSKVFQLTYKEISPSLNHSN